MPDVVRQPQRWMRATATGGTEVRRSADHQYVTLLFSCTPELLLVSPGLMLLARRAIVRPHGRDNVMETTRLIRVAALSAIAFLLATPKSWAQG
jgi:hypothetical protein